MVSNDTDVAPSFCIRYASSAPISFSPMPSLRTEGIWSATFDAMIHACLIASISFASLTRRAALMASPTSTICAWGAARCTAPTLEWMMPGALIPSRLTPLRASAIRTSRSALLENTDTSALEVLADVSSNLDEMRCTRPSGHRMAGHSSNRPPLRPVA